ncbi:MAG: RNA-binding protein [Dehalococcoidales bacterium]
MNIYVGNLSLAVTEEELHKQFAVFGEVLSMSIMDDKYIGSGQTRAYAFVEMASRTEGEAAIAGLRGKMLKNRLLEVVAALPLDKNRGASPAGKTVNPLRRKIRQREH